MVLMRLAPWLGSAASAAMGSGSARPAAAVAPASRTSRRAALIVGLRLLIADTPLAGNKKGGRGGPPCARDGEEEHAGEVSFRHTHTPDGCSNTPMTPCTSRASTHLD